jgi:ABC-type branched-subunit amino acid transport system permease subunit
MQNNAEMAFGIVGILAFLVIGVIALAAFAFWIWMLIHAITNKGLNDTEKLLWVLVVLFTHFIGALIYFFVGRPKQNTVSGAAHPG